MRITPPKWIPRSPLFDGVAYEGSAPGLLTHPIFVGDDRGVNSQVGFRSTAEATLPEATTDARATTPTAIIRGLRRRGDETQFTQILWSISEAQPEFASAFVRVLLDAARANHPEKVARLEPVPTALTCRAEVVLGENLGRLDLRFDDVADFTLFVENKLYSGYGQDQVDRYLAALELLPAGRQRTALVAVTRDIPGYGEPPAEREGWLGSIRWATVLPELRRLPLPPPLGEHWRLLLGLMNEEGDLGMTKPNTNAIQDWANYATGSEELEKLLLQVRDNALGALHELLAAQYPTRTAMSLVEHHTFGRRGKVAVKHELTKSWIGFRIPAAERRRSRSRVL